MGGKVEYFSEGCANQYKNYNNMLNLCHHEEDFKLQASWSFLQLAMGNLFAMEYVVS